MKKRKKEKKKKKKKKKIGSNKIKIKKIKKTRKKVKSPVSLTLFCFVLFLMEGGGEKRHLLPHFPYPGLLTHHYSSQLQPRQPQPQPQPLLRHGDPEEFSPSKSAGTEDRRRCRGTFCHRGLFSTPVIW